MKVNVTLEFNSTEEAAEFLNGKASTAIKAVQVSNEEPATIAEEKPRASRSRTATPKVKATDAVVPHVPADPFPAAPAEPTTPFPATPGPATWQGIVAPPTEGHAFDSVSVINYVKSSVADAKAKGLTDPEIAKAFNDVFALLGVTPAPVSQLPPRDLYAFHLKLNGAIVKVLESKPQSFI